MVIVALARQDIGSPTDEVGNETDLLPSEKCCLVDAQKVVDVSHGSKIVEADKTNDINDIVARVARLPVIAPRSQVKFVLQKGCPTKIADYRAVRVCSGPTI